jgi:dihydroorotase
MKKILLKNARVVSADGIDEKDIVISGGKILKVCESGEGEDLLANIVDEKNEITVAADREEGSGEQSFGLSGLAGADLGGGGKGLMGHSLRSCLIIDCSADDTYVLPGLIDAHVHFREPGLTQKGDFASESRAALAGGITTIFDMPNTVPPTTTYEAFKEKVRIAEEKCLCNFKLFIGIGRLKGGDFDLSEIEKVAKDKKLGKFLAGVKVYMGCSTGCMEGGESGLEKILAEKSLKKIPVVVHAEDQNCLNENEGKFDPADAASHGDARPQECAVEGVKIACHLAKKYDRPIHIAHVTSRAELEVIKKFKDEKVTCEVSPRHLFLSDEMYGQFGHLLKVNPPVRSREIVGDLWNAVYDGEVDIFASDHSPHTLEEKGVGAADSGTLRFAPCLPSGMPEVQTMLSLLLNEVAHGKFGLKDIARMCCENPARIFGLEKVGCVADGFRADLVIVDLGEKHEITRESLLYKCGWSCYEGRVLKGAVKRVVLGGEII